MEAKSKKWATLQVVACAAVMFGLMGLIANSTSIFTAAVVTEYGFTTQESQLFFSIQNLVMVFLIPVAQVIGNKMNYRVCITIASALAIIGMFLLSVWTTPGTFYISAVLYGISYSFICYLLVALVIPNWFHVNAGSMMGIASAFTGVGGAIWSTVASVLIADGGLANAALIMAIISACITLPFTIFIIRLKPSDMGLKPVGYNEAKLAQANKVEVPTYGFTLKEAVKTPVFWVAAIGCFLVYYACQFQTISTTYARVGLEIDAVTAGVMSSMIMVGLIFGKIILGFISDKAGAKWVYVYSVISGAAAFLLFFTATQTSTVQLFIGAFLFGGFFALMAIGTPRMVRYAFGPKDYAKIMSWLMTVGLLANTIGSFVNGTLADTVGYNVAILIGLAAAIVGVVLTIAAISMGKKKWAKEIAAEEAVKLAAKAK